MSKKMRKPVITKKVLAWLIIAYAVVFVAGFGTYFGVFFEQFGLQHWLKAPSDGGAFKPPSFWESFTASALQDVLFFLGIGFLLFWHSNRDPKDDDFITKVNYFYPDVPADSEHMKYLINVMNKSSCVSMGTEKNIAIIDYRPESSDGNEALFKVDACTVNKLVNLHHNHDLIKNEGMFKIIPDKAKFPDDIWGYISEISLRTEHSDDVNWIARAVTLKEKEYSAPYHIKLKAGEKGELKSSHQVWQKQGEESKIRVQLYTKNYSLNVENKLEDTSLEISIQIPGSSQPKIFNLEPGEGLPNPETVQNFKPVTDVLILNIKKV